jgi:hypothetical protein
MIRSAVARIRRSVPRCAVAAALVFVLVFAAACDEGADAPQNAPRAAMCRQLMTHIFQITPPPGSDRPETDPARLQALTARVPIEDIEQCAAVKDEAVIRCMQEASDARALRKCIPAQAE